MSALKLSHPAVRVGPHPDKFVEISQKRFSNVSTLLGAGTRADSYVAGWYKPFTAVHFSRSVMVVTLVT